MSISYWKKGSMFIIAVLCRFISSAQLTTGPVKQYLSDNIDKIGLGINYPDLIKEFYGRLNYQTAWIQSENTKSLSVLLNLLSSAGSLGLNERDYQFDVVTAFKKSTMQLQNRDDSLKEEVLFTDAAIHFYNDISHGNITPALGYTGINYNPECHNIPTILAEYISNNKLSLLPSFLSPSMPEIIPLENKINWIVEAMNKNNFKETLIISKNIDVDNKPLCLKLYQLGILDSTYENISEDTLNQKIRESQLMFNLPVNGELNKELIRELNVSLKIRLKELNLSINYYRWLSCLTQNQQVIVVNIPAAYLKVYHDNKVALEMRLVVGKPSTPTFTLASIVNEVIVYPFWYVPHSIATKELLPPIKRNPSYIDANNYQVLNKEGKIIDPYSVNWEALSRNYFPYTIRQGTGCDNSLGLLKLNFYNPFGAYLHDTPDKNLFKQHQRFFSHGCMRMEKPIELGHLVLRNNQIAIDTLTEKSCLKNQSPITIPADIKMPVIVWYNPASIDSTGNLIFFDDVYRKFNWGN